MALFGSALSSRGQLLYDRNASGRLGEPKHECSKCRLWRRWPRGLRLLKGLAILSLASLSRLVNRFSTVGLRWRGWRA